MKNEFGSTLRHLRVSSRRTLKYVGEISGYSQQCISDMEGGYRAPPTSYKRVEKICEAIGGDPFELYMAAVRDRGEVRITHLSPQKMEWAAQFAKMLETHTEQQIQVFLGCEEVGGVTLTEDGPVCDTLGTIKEGIDE